MWGEWMGRTCSVVNGKLRVEGNEPLTEELRAWFKEHRDLIVEELEERQRLVTEFKRREKEAQVRVEAEKTMFELRFRFYEEVSYDAVWGYDDLVCEHRGRYYLVWHDGELNIQELTREEYDECLEENLELGMGDVA